MVLCDRRFFTGLPAAAPKPPRISITSTGYAAETIPIQTLRIQNLRLSKPFDLSQSLASRLRKTWSHGSSANRPKSGPRRAQQSVIGKYGKGLPLTEGQIMVQFPLAGRKFAGHTLVAPVNHSIPAPSCRAD